jgi:carboxyl-terminal processing protease
MKKQFLILGIIAIVLLFIPNTDLTQDLRADENEYYYKIKKGLTYFRKVYERVQSHYVEEIDPYEFVKAGIDGMLETLDPYTVFIEQEADARLKIITTGKYGGLGLEIGMRNDRITVISPMDNSPAKRAGIRAGDIIEKIDGEPVKDMSPDKISKLLRGPIGTKVNIVLSRPQFDQEIPMTITRGEIVLEDVSFADFIEPGVVYLRLTGFTEKAGKEMRSAIEVLQNQSPIKMFILDLRGNSGGLLESAVEVSSIFLPKNTTVVTTKGFRDGEHVFKTRQEPILPYVPLTLLVDGGSASASEIVAGALQDLDRGIILGTNTFGKGLVQKVYNIDKDSSTKIKVTTAKYYIPSGRCVQKQDYASNKEIFYNGSQDTITDTSDKIYYTVNRRPMYEKGGITPDRIITEDEMAYVVNELWRQSIPFNFAVKYKQENANWDGPFELNDTLFNEFINYVLENGFDYQVEGEKELRNFIELMENNHLGTFVKTDAENLLSKLASLKKNDLLYYKNEISKILLDELAEKYFGNREKIRYSLKYDQQILDALDVLRNKNVYEKILAIN